MGETSYLRGGLRDSASEGLRTLKRTHTVAVAERREATRAYQANEREDFMAERFGMFGTRQGRGGLDAEFEVAEDRVVPFELKSTDANSFSTARDVGREHIQKWRRRHWLFGVFDRGQPARERAREFLYASPAQLAPWIDRQEEYVGIDWDLVNRVPGLIDMATMRSVVGDKPEYDLTDVRKLLKNQKLEAGEEVRGEVRALLAERGLAPPRRMTVRICRELMDRAGGYSPERMVVLVRERCRYLLDRGATRNNPHIPLAELRQLVPPEQRVRADARINFRDWLSDSVRRELDR